jgi:hypothetical protein
MVHQKNFVSAIHWDHYCAVSAKGWRYCKRFLSIAGLLVVLGHLAGSSGIIEGLYMLRPEFVTPDILFRSLPEPIVQGCSYQRGLQNG